MADPVKPYTFVADDDAVADEVNANFDALFDWVSTGAIHKDATKAFTAIPSGPATNPTTDNQFTRKKYVDDQLTASAAAIEADLDTTLDARPKLIAAKYSTSDGTSIGQTFVSPSGLSITHTFVNNRVYRFTCHMSLKMRSGGTGYLMSITEAGTQVARVAMDLNYTGQSGVTAHGTWTPKTISGAHTYALAIRTNVGELDLTGTQLNHTFTLEDLGPAPA